MQETSGRSVREHARSTEDKKKKPTLIRENPQKYEKFLLL